MLKPTSCDGLAPVERVAELRAGKMAAAAGGADRRALLATSDSDGEADSEKSYRLRNVTA